MTLASYGYRSYTVPITATAFFSPFHACTATCALLLLTGRVPDSAYTVVVTQTDDGCDEHMGMATGYGWMDGERERQTDRGEMGYIDCRRE